MNKVTLSNTAPTAGTDPSTRPGFNPAWLPLANGSSALPPSADPRNVDVVREFQAAYYEINTWWAALRTLRAQPDAPDFAQQERTALQNIETALRHRDELEDRFAPVGIIAEPLMENGLTRDIQFTFGSVTPTGRFRAQPFVSSAQLAFRVPARAGRLVKPPGPPPANATTVFPCAE
jgi:hypothetical protein